MPNHWESSGRPLFVKTVFVNGNRHAILSQTDPLLHGTTPTLKKKRPGSSLSTESILSLTSSESQECEYEKKSKSLKPRRSYAEEDISSQLQGCLIKLRLASSRQNYRKSKKDLNDSRDQMSLKGFEKTTSKQKRKKLNNKSDNNFEESGKENQQEPKKEIDNCCYVYNYENFKGKKNYCFVKITSQPSHFILKCSCDKNWRENQNYCGSKESNYLNKNNLVISATFHNLSMSTVGKEEQSQNSYDSSSNLFSMESLDSCELYWNNSQSKLHYNSLSDRVIQWLDLANKRQNHEIVSSTIEDVSNNIERIFSGRMYEEIKSAAEKSIRIEKAVTKKERERIAQREPDLDVETEVKVEGNIETALSIEKLQTGFAEWEEILSNRKVSRPDITPIEKIVKKNSGSMSENSEDLEMISIPTKNDQNFSIATYLKNSIASHLTTSKSQVSMNVQELLLDAREALKKLENQKKKTKSKQSLVRKIKFQEPGEEEEKNAEISEDEDFKITAIKYWKTKINKRNGFNESMTVQSNRQTGDCVKQIKNRNLKGDFERYKQSIDNPNITQSRPTSHNLSSPQQFNKILFPRDGKDVWPTDKDLGRPQLHIFIPNVPLKEPSEDSVSECESFLEEVS